MQMFGTSKTKSHIKCISDNMYKQLPDKTDGDNGTAVSDIRGSWGLFMAVGAFLLEDVALAKTVCKHFNHKT